MNHFLTAFAIIVIYIYYIFQSFILLLIPRRFRRKKEITGQKVLITGAGNGLGRELAVEFSKHSTCLILLDIDKQALQKTASLIDASSSVFFYECDVTDRTMVYTVAESIKDDVGDVDILVNNAGIVSGNNFLDLSDEKIVKTMEVNAISHFWLCKSFLPPMMARNNGHIVTVASLAGLTGVPRLTDYCASKYAAIGFTEALEMELRLKNLKGIKFTIVCPSVIGTALFDGVRSPFEKPLHPEYVAEKIVEGVREEKETIFIPHAYTYCFMFKSSLPRWFWILGLKMTNFINFMDGFKDKPNTEKEGLLT